MSKNFGKKEQKSDQEWLSPDRRQNIILAYLENDAKTFIRKMQNRHVLPEEYGPILKKYLEDEENNKLDPEDNGIGTFKLKTPKNDLD